MPSSTPLFIFPEKDELVVDQIKTLKRELKYSYTENVVVALGGVDVSSSEVQNMLLKFLEEHSSYLHIFLFVTRLSGLLPTVSSRCSVEDVAGVQSPQQPVYPLEFEMLGKAMTQMTDITKETVDAFIQSILGKTTSLSELRFLLTHLRLLRENNMSPFLIYDNVLIFFHKKSTMK